VKPSPSEVVFRTATEGDIAPVNSFNEVGERKWRHEFFAPEKSGSVLALAVSGDEVIGTEGFISYPVFWRGKPHLSHRSERTLLNPAFRGRGIFDALVSLCASDAVRQGSLCCWGSTGALKAFAAAGFLNFKGHRTYMLVPLFTSRAFTSRFWRASPIPLNPFRLMREVRKRNARVIWELLGLASCVLKPRTRKLATDASAAPCAEITDSPRAPSDIDDLHARIQQSDVLLYLQHSDELFRWQQRGGEDRYLMVCCYAQSVLRAYLYVHLPAQSTVANVVDFCAESELCLATALAALRDKLRTTPFASLIFIVNKDNLEQQQFMRHLQPYASLRAGKGGTMVVKPLAGTDPELYQDLSRWYLTDLWLQL
jgi:GNAT superfamily N-acetyltransferase